MNNLIVYPSITAPRRRANLLSRPRLLHRLEEMLDYKLTLVVAPPGYGKTSLLADFAQQARLPVCWYSIDPLDRDPRRFLAHFIAAIAHLYPEFGQKATAMLETPGQTEFDHEHLVVMLVNEAHQYIQERFLVVLDDFHFVKDQPQILSFIQRFAERVDENCCLVIASRCRPDLPGLERMVGRSQVDGIDQNDLAFTAKENP